MEDMGDAAGDRQTDADFDRMQEELDDVGGELAALKQEAKHLLEATQTNRTVRPSFEPS